MSYGYLDFETEAIEAAPAYPPAPVGFSYKVPGMRAPKYMAWGHPEGNNCTKPQAKRVLDTMWADSKMKIVCQNGKFDHRVAQDRMGMAPLPWDRCEDTMFLLALHNPHSRSLGLKQAATAILGMPPDEQDAVTRWLYDHKVIRSMTQKDRGAFIARAPASVVGPYANGDIERTEALFKRLHKDVTQTRGMAEAYEREQRLMPILLRNEREGVRVDLRGLERDVPLYRASMEKTDAWIRKRLKVPGLNVDSDSQLAEALDAAGVVTEWQYTDKGNRITRKDTLTPDMFSDWKVASAIGYRNRLATVLSTFMEKWLVTARASEGWVYTDWNQTRSDSGGARTFRLSSAPNFQNLPTDFNDKNDGYLHPAFIKGLLELPLTRKYFLPDHNGNVWVSRDYASQEIRVLAHFEDGELMRQFNANPRLDVHTYVQNMIKEEYGLEYERGKVKIINFLSAYGGGTNALMLKTGMPKGEAERFRAAYKKVLPGVDELNAQVRAVLKSGQPCRTWGGREVFAEPPMLINGRMMDFTYKVPNMLIQSSSAEQTKQAIINYDATRRDGRMLLTVHDEININAPAKSWKREAKILEEAMLAPRFDVPMLTDLEIGPHWGALVKVKE